MKNGLKSFQRKYLPMNTMDTAENRKEIIKRELFKEVNLQNTILDEYLIRPEKFDISTISNSSREFLAKNKEYLQKERGKGQILFLRKYGYEKILNEYLQKRYHVDRLEMDDFPSEEKRRELQVKKQLEIKKRDRMSQEQQLIKELGTLKWEKTFRISHTVYEAKNNDGKAVRVVYYQNPQKKQINTFIYDKQEISYVKYDIKKVVDIIEHAKPIIKQANHMSIVIRPKKSKKSSKKKKQTLKKQIDQDLLDQDLLEQNKAILAKEIQKIAEKYKLSDERVKNIIKDIVIKCPYNRGIKCTRTDNERCNPYYKICIHYDTFISKVIAESQKVNKLQVKKIQSNTVKNPEKNVIGNQKKEIINCNIGLKDFLIRTNIFKCMHDKHKIDNVVAMINIDENGKKKSIKVAAGYCSKCKIYFIMESTYQELKRKGIILCRITDEKTYYKGGFMNGSHLAQQSILMQYGYNVSQVEGLSTVRRQKILAVMIDNNILSKSEIISYLDFFINQRAGRSNMELAISKWEADREFVEQYRIGEYTRYGVNAIHRR